MTTPGPDDDGGPVESSVLYARDAEVALLGHILYHPPGLRDAAAVVAPEDFADSRLGQVYGLVAGLVSAATNPSAVDFLTVRAEIVRRRTDPQGGPLWLDDGELAALMTSGTGRWEGPARLVVAAAVRRRMVKGAQQTIADALHVDDPALVAQGAVERFKALRDAQAPVGRLTARTLGEVLDVEDEGYDWIIPDLLERGDRLIVTGEEGLGKSEMLRQIAICAAAGVHPFRLSAMRPVRVVVVDAENSERQWRRKTRGMVVNAARGGSANPRDNVHVACVGRMDLTGPGDIAALHGLLDEHVPDILVIGPLYKMLPREITTDTDAAPLIAALDSLRDRPDGPCLVMEAHMGHGKTGAGGRDPRPRGSSALLGWPEFGFGLLKNSEHPESIVDVRRWRGDRDERDWPEQLSRGGPFPWSDERLPAARRVAFRAGGAAANDGWSPSDVIADDLEPAR